MTRTLPLATRELRWFFEGAVDDHPGLKRWFETTAPMKRATGLGSPEWEGRVDDEPDVYLPLPDSVDMGIKWREGALQIKGRVSALGTQGFCGRHEGRLEAWLKWSYADLPAAYRGLFAQDQRGDPPTIAVRKTRALRLARLNGFTGEAVEVASGTVVERGVGVELTDLEVMGTRWCTLAFEAFPADEVMHGLLFQTVERFLAGLTSPQLTAAQSKSYPAWLAELSSRAGA